MKNRTKPVSLRNKTPFGEGQTRTCYEHPETPSLCIKIIKQSHLNNKLKKTPYPFRFLRKKYINENIREEKGYKQKAVRKSSGRVWDHLPRLYGWVETDIGPGLVSDYYTTQDGVPAPTLETLLEKHGLTPALETAIDELQSYLNDTLLITRSLMPQNLVLADDGKLKIIDGIGGRRLISPDITIKKARRHVKRCIEFMNIRIAMQSQKSG